MYEMWKRIVNILIGLWLVVAPAILRIDREAAVVLYIIGPLVTSVAIISMIESVQNFRYVNIVFAICLMFSLLFLEADRGLVISNLICGFAITGCALVRGKVKKRFGGGWRSLLNKAVVRVFND